MIFTETPLKGAFVLEIQKREDSRGWFGRSFCAKELEAQGLTSKVVNTNVGFSKQRGTLRGMHLQIAPHAEAKLVRCTMGAIYDVIVDLRPDSPTHRQWFGIELSAENRKQLFVPEGFAHGYQTLADNTEITYQTSEFYAPTCAKGVRYNDAAFKITWPLAVSSISEADEKWPDYTGKLG
jgi:dTDP-4-dehydrorhamnose 3,5-epimerase